MIAIEKKHHFGLKIAGTLIFAALLLSLAQKGYEFGRWLATNHI